MAWDRRLGGSDRLAGVPAGPGPRHLVHRCIRLRPRGIWVGRSQTLLRSWMRETLGRQEPDSPAVLDAGDPVPLDLARRPSEAPTATHPVADPDRGREHPCVLKLHRPLWIPGAHRPPTGGASPRDGPAPTQLRLVALPDRSHRAESGTRRAADGPGGILSGLFRAPAVAAHWQQFGDSVWS
jgi:hypothetical protein